MMKKISILLLFIFLYSSLYAKELSPFAFKEKNPTVPSLIGLYHFNEMLTGGGTTYNSGTGAGEAYMRGGTYVVSGKYSKGIYLDGINGRIYISSGITYTDNFTIMMWVKNAHETATAMKLIDIKNAANAYAPMIELAMTYPTLCYAICPYVAGIYGGYFITTVSRKYLGWMLVTVTKSGGIVRAYLNDTEATPTDWAAGSPAEVATVYRTNATIGSLKTLTGWFHGTVDDVIIFNRALNKGEVIYIYKEQKGNHID